MILYVEDDALLQMDGSQVLEAAGYQVVLASDGDEACAALRRHGDDLSALMTDIRLGGSIDGWAVAEFGRTIIERLPVLYMTGSEGGDFAARGVARGLMVLKPFCWPEILRSVSVLLH